jgi:uroporphyrinogen-III synthase
LRESLISSLNSHVIVAAVGPSTKKTLEENYVHVDVMPAVYKMGAMVKSLSDYLSQSQAASKKRQK